MTKIVKNIIVTVSFILIAIIISGTVVTLNYIRDMKEEQKQAAEEESQIKESENLPSITLEEKAQDVQITISAVGDCTLGTDPNYSYGATFVAEYNKVKDPSHFLKNVQPIFANDDLTIANFEGTLTHLTTRQDKTFAFRADPEYAQILTSGSVEAVSLANNHSRDYGAQSLVDTKNHLTQAGITHFGYDQSVVVESKGVKIGLVGIYVLQDGLGRMQQLQEQIQKVKSEGAVITIVMFHWGIEGSYKPNNVQVQLARAAIDNGADLVLGGHPHVLQGIENYKGRKIVYSLGNFCFGGNKNPKDKDTMIFQQTFIVRDKEILNHDEINIIPCSLSSVQGRNNYQPITLEGNDKERVMNKLREISSGLSQEAWEF